MIERVLDDAQPTAVCTTLEHVRKLPAAAGEMAIICEDDSAHEEIGNNEQEWSDLWSRYERCWCEEGDNSNHEKTSLDDLAFIVYSSGTTGQ